MSERDNPYQPGYGDQLSGTAGFTATTGTGSPGAGMAPGNAAAAAASQPPASGGGSLDQLVGGASPAGEADVISETTTAKFTADVIQASRQQPVLVDFWAPWCEPCKQLTPVLEKAVRAAGGRVRLVKLNIDDHPAIPGQLGIQSIPAVIAFVDGQPADGFMGAVPESQITEFIDKIAGPSKSGAQDQLAAVLDEAKAALAAGDVNAAAQGFTMILQQDPQNAKAIAGMAECLLAAQQSEKAKEVLAGLGDEQRKDPDVAAVAARIEQMEEVAALGDPDALNGRLDANPDDHAARLDLAKILNVRGEREAAADHLLTIMRKDRQWQDDEARRTLLTFFEAWGPADPATLSARRKLSSILFS